MLQILFNGHPVMARDGATILEAAYEDKYARTQFDLEIPTLQYLKGVQEKDDSGVCIVEVQGKGIVNAAATLIEPDMKVITDSAAVRFEQTKALKEILDHHDRDCRHCSRTGNCELQDIQHKLRTTKNPAKEAFESVPVKADGIIVRDDNKNVRLFIRAIGKFKMINRIKLSYYNLAIIVFFKISDCHVNRMSFIEIFPYHKNIFCIRRHGKK